MMATRQSPFTATLLRTFQDADCVFFLSELYTGGDLLGVIERRHRESGCAALSARQTTFALGCIALGLAVVECDGTHGVARVLHPLETM